MNLPNHFSNFIDFTDGEKFPVRKSISQFWCWQFSILRDIYWYFWILSYIYGVSVNIMLISVPTAVSRRPLLRARGKEVLPGGLWAAFRSHLLRVWTVHYRWEKNGGIAANMETKCDCREKWWSPHCFTYWFWSYLFLVHLSVSCITLDPSRKMCAFIDPTDYKFNSAGCIGSKLLFYPLKISIRVCPMISLYLRGWLRLQNSYKV